MILSNQLMNMFVDNKNKIVFLASPKPQNSEEKAWAWTQVHDDKNLIEFLKVSNTNTDLGFLNIAQVLTIMMACLALIIFFKIKTNLFK